MGIAVGGERSGDFDPFQPRVGRDDVKIWDAGLLDDLFKLLFALQHSGHAVVFVGIEPKASRQVGLGIEVDQQHFFLMEFCQGCSEVQSGGGFGCSPFKAADG